ncbi:hypothetical protein ACKEW3_19600, partial [Yersinia enterocolitica]
MSIKTHFFESREDNHVNNKKLLNYLYFQLIKKIFCNACLSNSVINLRPFQTADEPHYFGGVLSFERPQVAIAIFFPFTLPALSATAC